MTDRLSPSAPATILLTRPRDAAERTARALREAGLAQGLSLSVVVSPILRIELFAVSARLDRDCALVLSSAHAVAALQQAGKADGQRAYCVGASTAHAAQAAGLEALSADGDAADLVRLVQRSHAAGPLVWLRGAHHRESLSDGLRAAGFDMSECVVYDQRPCPLDARARNILAEPSPVLLPIYSPRSAHLLGQACRDAAAPLELVAISPAALADWDGPRPAWTGLAAHPDGPSMVRALLCRARELRSG